MTKKQERTIRALLKKVERAHATLIDVADRLEEIEADPDLCAIAANCHPIVNELANTIEGTLS